MPAILCPSCHKLISSEEPRPLRKFNPTVPADLETIVLKAMAKDRNERYATAQELADDLRRFLGHMPIRARRPTMLQRAGKWARRHMPVVWSAAALLVMATVGSLIAATLIWEKQQELEESNQALSEKQETLKAALDKLWQRPYDCRIFTLQLLQGLAQLDDSSLCMMTSCFARYLERHSVPSEEEEEE